VNRIGPYLEGQPEQVKSSKENIDSEKDSGNRKNKYIHFRGVEAGRSYQLHCQLIRPGRVKLAVGTTRDEGAADRKRDRARDIEGK
jgi:hypothetical protein